ncbi:hypothetical protein A3K63_03415 [Candidatus Micrarchaeota archaeon RBG_16_49_10]|nr:MAG: hypothetical protein A3K63_03415 [Candidatus Micrarchaeota archaeon RBG_16_49_10]
MEPEYHVFASLLISLAFFLVTKSLFASLLCLIVGIFIDTDHIIDYLIDKRRVPTIKQFFDYFYSKKYERIRVLFHSLEFTPLIFLASRWLFGLVPAYGIMAGFLSHMALDYIGNRPRPFTYFLTYRIIVGFKADMLVRTKK